MLNDKILTLNLPYSELFNTVKRGTELERHVAFSYKKPSCPNIEA